METCLIWLLVAVLGFLLLGVVVFSACDPGSYGPREIIRWGVEKGWITSWTKFDVYEGTPFTKKEFDEITAKAESLGKDAGLKYLRGVINSRFYGFGVYC